MSDNKTQDEIQKALAVAGRSGVQAAAATYGAAKQLRELREANEAKTPTAKS